MKIILTDGATGEDSVVYYAERYVIEGGRLHMTGMRDAGALYALSIPLGDGEVVGIELEQGEMP